VMPGETVVLYGNGFGAASPVAPNGTILVAPLSLAVLPTVTIGGLPATVTYGGLIEPGVYRINVVAPVGGQQSQANAFLSVLYCGARERCPDNVRLTP